ncbi:hypothetical protein PIROE2DRAFT_2862, partial [Piromyces sp. E2]
MLSPEEFVQHGQDSPWFVFFGSKTSVKSESFTSVWIEFQNQADKEDLTSTINIGKVECTQYSVFCRENKIEYFPTLI